MYHVSRIGLDVENDFWPTANGHAIGIDRRAARLGIDVSSVKFFEMILKG